MSVTMTIAPGFWLESSHKSILLSTGKKFTKGQKQHEIVMIVATVSFCMYPSTSLSVSICLCLFVSCLFSCPIKYTHITHRLQVISCYSLTLHLCLENLCFCVIKFSDLNFPFAILNT